ncbi:phosphoadenosine phosphosulfate reductase domain-containing protein [Spiroplasma apis]|uniref:Phosphoadenosine phosphosulphate reductase domain-containing protein n=1 Tax=Spiroplasma apis B31 TaxID=1276258 RepID=V5RIM8_SPIAP|nr:phosphoadenosine phosphosulfate reductase family protein [Spiroplasma apis]AHB36338.1 hypothetical protein SAPIS_v1c04930 [Spiroplasma apis B31]
MKEITKELYEKAKNEVKRVYRLNDAPFLLGFSGGKDSTLTLDIVLRSLDELYRDNPKLITKPTFIISSDTLIENPFVVKRIDELEDYINSNNLEYLKIKFIRAKPSVNESFWTLVIGRGYPLPLNRFRWCTRHLKIKPMELASFEIQNEYTNIINVLGLRKNESSSRKKKMNESIVENESYLFKNFEEQRNVIFAPIQEFEIENLWDYLVSVEHSFWKSNFKILFQMYQDSSKECPTSNEMRLIAGKSDTCGNSRWGCWICPLSNNIWIDNMFENGILDFKPVVEFRKMLLFERDLLINRYLGKHIRRSNGKYILGIRGLQKLKYDEINKIFYRPEKQKSRIKEVIIENGLVKDGYNLLNESKINDIPKQILYNESLGAASNIVVKKNNEFFILAPGPYTLTYRVNLLKRLINLKHFMKDKKIRAGTEDANIDIISNNEFKVIIEMLRVNSKAISDEKFIEINPLIKEVENLWEKTLKI